MYHSLKVSLVIALGSIWNEKKKKHREALNRAGFTIKPERGCIAEIGLGQDS